jgi:hypothetical protein
MLVSYEPTDEDDYCSDCVDAAGDRYMSELETSADSLP